MFTRKPSNGTQGDSAHATSPLASQPQRFPPSFPPSALANAIETAAALPHEEGLVVIGKGTRVHGKIGDCRKLDVHGVLEADVVTDMLIVREGGGFKGTMKTDNAQIHGVVEGTLVVHEHLDIQRTGDVTGDISYQTLAIQSGAKMRGTILCHEPPSVETARSSEPTADVISISGHHHGNNGYAVDEPIRSHTSTPIS